MVDTDSWRKSKATDLAMETRLPKLLRLYSGFRSVISIKDDENHMALTLTECVRIFLLGSDELWIFEERKSRVNFSSSPLHRA